MGRMTCARCEQLAEENAYLKRELAIEVDEMRARTLARKLGVTPKCAEILMMLYAAKGRTVQSWSIRDNCKTEGDHTKVVHVYVHRLREALGKGAVLTDWGAGYALSPDGLARVAEMLGEGRPQA